MNDYLLDCFWSQSSSSIQSAVCRGKGFFFFPRAGSTCWKIRISRNVPASISAVYDLNVYQQFFALSPATSHCCSLVFFLVRVSWDDRSQNVAWILENLPCFKQAVGDFLSAGEEAIPCLFSLLLARENSPDKIGVKAIDIADPLHPLTRLFLFLHPGESFVTITRLGLPVWPEGLGAACQALGACWRVCFKAIEWLRSVLFGLYGWSLW